MNNNGSITISNSSSGYFPPASASAAATIPSSLPASHTAAMGKKVRLHFSATKLADMDTFSKSDPYVVLYSNSTFGIAEQPQQQPTNAAAAQRRMSTTSSSGAGAVSRYGRELGRTEIISNTLNPVFTRSIEVTFLFEARQPMTVAVYDDDGHKDDTKNDLCGVATFQLSQVICSRDGKKTFDLSPKGQITIAAEEINTTSSRDTMAIAFRGENLKKMSVFGQPTAYYKLLRRQPNGTKHEICRSVATGSGTNQPRWAPTPALSLRDLQGPNPDERVLELHCYDQNALGDEYMGYVSFSVADLRNAQAQGIPLGTGVLTKDKNRAAGALYGEIFVTSIEVTEHETFMQALNNGWQVNLAVSIDFTGSNGDPRRPTSLHYMDPQRPNQYVSAIMSVGEVLMEYDTDKQVPVFGFGASKNGQTQHFFHVNQQANPYVNGVQGVLDCYGSFLPTCILSGPTNFAPTIRSVTQGAREVEGDRVYTILLIITDGEITDMAEAVDALVEADDAPLSIVIVGVGHACDFQAMDELDGDDAALQARSGRISKRDLVQFVPYRDFMNCPREALAAAVLEEIPDQYEVYSALAAQRRQQQRRAPTGHARR